MAETSAHFALEREREREGGREEREREGGREGGRRGRGRRCVHVRESTGVCEEISD